VGLVIALEPIIASTPSRLLEGENGWTIRTANGSLAAHDENTIVVTSAGSVLLTAEAA
jgi:methionyl aminopeptidase